MGSCTSQHLVAVGKRCLNMQNFDISCDTHMIGVLIIFSLIITFSCSHDL
jgi:hypothetical protein